MNIKIKEEKGMIEMKKTKRIVSVVLSLLSTVSCKAFARNKKDYKGMNRSLSTEEFENKFEYDEDVIYQNDLQEYTDFNSTVNYEQNKCKSVNEYNPYLITGAALGGLGLLGYLGYSRYLRYLKCKELYRKGSFANKVIVKYGETILKEFKTCVEKEDGKQEKEYYPDNKFWKWIDSCDDNTKKELLCNFFFVYTAVSCLSDYSRFKNYIVDFMMDNSLVMYNFARTVNYIYNPNRPKSETFKAPNVYPLFTAILRLFGPDGKKTISEKFNNDENAIYVYNTCNQRLNEFLLKVNNTKNEAKEYSFLAYFIGLDLWEKLFPGRKFDEREYLRLNEKLCIM